MLLALGMDYAHNLSLDVGCGWELLDFSVYQNAYLYNGHLEFIISQSFSKLEGVFWMYYYCLSYYCNASYILVLAVDF